jgi:hypothetical protein
MRPAIIEFLGLLALGASVCGASQTTMSWWNGNGDSVVLDGVTITLTGTGIEKDNGVVRDPLGPEDATLTFSFNPPIDGFQMYIQSVAPWEWIEFQGPLPASVTGPGMVTEGTPIQRARGFFPNDDNTGVVTWEGMLTSVTFTMAHADGAIEIAQMGQPWPVVLQNSIVLQATPMPGEILVSMAISDAGAVPALDGFVVQRHAVYPCDSTKLVHCVATRELETVTHVTVADTDVQPGTQYVYQVLGSQGVPCLPGGNQYEFQEAFDPTGWGFEIVAFASMSVDPTPVAHGRLVSVPNDQPTYVRVEPCADSCSPYQAGFATEDVLQYLGTDTEVVVYGSISYAGNNYGYTFARLVGRVRPRPARPGAWSRDRGRGVAGDAGWWRWPGRRE